MEAIPELPRTLSPDKGSPKMVTPVFILGRVGVRGGRHELSEKSAELGALIGYHGVFDSVHCSGGEEHLFLSRQKTGRTQRPITISLVRGSTIEPTGELRPGPREPPVPQVAAKVGLLPGPPGLAMEEPLPELPVVAIVARGLQPVGLVEVPIVGPRVRLVPKKVPPCHLRWRLRLPCIPLSRSRRRSASHRPPDRLRAGRL